MECSIFLLLMWLILFLSGAAMILAALAIEAGLPDGVLNIVHGTHVSFSSFKTLLFSIFFTGKYNSYTQKY
jgi:acyl-CoA reductase-like NAD-dependent aldehyde dehydrogenase